MNDYYNFEAGPNAHQKARALDVVSNLIAIAAAFDKIPSAEALGGGAVGYGVTAGSATHYTLTVTPPIATMVSGLRVRAKIHATNGASPFLSVSGLPEAQIRDYLGQALPAGSLPTGMIASLDFDGAYWRVSALNRPTTIGGFGVGAVGAGAPLVADFHDTSLGAGLYRYGQTSLNSPVAGSSGSAILTYRGDGQAHWEAFQISGATDTGGEPVIFRKRTTGAVNNWRPWFQDEEFTSNANGVCYRTGGGLQVCMATVDLVWLSGAALGKDWTFPRPFSGAPLFLSGAMPSNNDGVYTSCNPEDFGATVTRKIAQGSTAGVAGQVAFRKVSSGTFVNTATVTNATVFAIGRWF